MAYDEFLADRIRNQLNSKRVGFDEKKMMGGLCFMVDDKMCIGVHTDQIMCRVGPDMYEECLKKEGCIEMAFTGRPMKGFVWVESSAIDDEKYLESWVDLCLAYNPIAKASKKRKKIPPSELILNDDGSIYHLKLKEEHVADTVIIVGDQSRVEIISSRFDKIEYKISNREFVTHTGIYKNKRISVASTGIGTDNIDIFMNELDAVVNIDFEKRVPKTELKSLNIIRLGTSGALHRDIVIGSFVLSEYAIGWDGLAYHYGYEFSEEEIKFSKELIRHLNPDEDIAKPCIVKGSDTLASKLGQNMFKGITATATGVYAPQGRTLRLSPKHPDFNDKLSSFEYRNQRITNLEMETSALFTLGKMLGHRCTCCCVILANRVSDTFVENHSKAVDGLITEVLNRISEDSYF